jgi:hypothetical protein
MAFNFFTAFHNAMMDPAAYASFSKEMNLKAVEQVFFNSLAGKSSFDAVVLPEDINSSKVFDGKRAVRIRPLGIHDFIIPEPCSFTDPNTIKTVLSLHPVAYPDNDVPLIEQPEGAGQVSFNSRIVECFFKNGPQSSGKLRGLTYRLRRESSVSVNINTDCLGGVSGGSAGDFESGGYGELIRPTAGKISNGKNIPGGLNIKWDLLKKIGKQKLLGPLLKDIALYESGPAAYDAYNRGSCENCGALPVGEFEKIFGKKLSELTIEQVTKNVQKGGRLKGKSAFAVGKYQIIPSTLREAVDTIKGLNTTEVFGKEQQEGLAAYLVLMKQPILGKYLLGSTTITAGAAQTAMASEWAGIRLIENAYRPADPAWPAANLIPGQSYYIGVGRNPPDIRLKRAQNTAVAIEKTRQSIDTSSDFQKLIKEITG